MEVGVLVASETALILNSYVPAGFELGITELGDAAPERTLPPKGRTMQHSPEEMARVIFKKYCVPFEMPRPLRYQQLVGIFLGSLASGQFPCRSM